MEQQFKLSLKRRYPPVFGQTYFPTITCDSVAQHQYISSVSSHFPASREWPPTKKKMENS